MLLHIVRSTVLRDNFIPCVVSSATSDCPSRITNSRPGFCALPRTAAELSRTGNETRAYTFVGGWRAKGAEQGAGKTMMILLMRCLREQKQHPAKKDAGCGRETRSKTPRITTPQRCSRQQENEHISTTRESKLQPTPGTFQNVATRITVCRRGLESSCTAVERRVGRFRRGAGFVTLNRMGSHPISLPGPSDVIKFFRDDRTATSANFSPCF